jgi:hypothetical protein
MSNAYSQVKTRTLPSGAVYTIDGEAMRRSLESMGYRDKHVTPAEKPFRGPVFVSPALQKEYSTGGQTKFWSATGKTIKASDSSD